MRKLVACCRNRKAGEGNSGSAQRVLFGLQGCPMDEVLENIRSFIAYRVKEGFETEDEIVENATAHAQETYAREGLQPEIERTTAEFLAIHREEQSRWEYPTDCDRLDQAFAALNQLGIVARQDFSCCTPCGHQDIWDEITQVEETQPVEGYVFYHFQGTEQAIETGQLLLAYGSLEEDQKSFEKVGNTIVQELCKVGLHARWDGSPNSPIEVSGLVWRRRR